jgi:CheY-like chemotaxis protein
MNPPAPIPGNTPAPATNAPRNGVRTGHILVVDDDVGMRALASAIIKSVGLTSVAVTNGEEAIEIYRDCFVRGEPFDAVIMDLALPGGISGLEATDCIKRLNPSAKIVACSGYLEQNARAAAIERGFIGILPKPYTAERLSAELRWVLSRRQQI